MSTPPPDSDRSFSRPFVEPIQPSTVYQCRTPEEAERLLAGELPGYVYSRDGHPNADELARLLCDWHRGEAAIVAGSGMAALALAMLAWLDSGDRLLISRQLFGKSQSLFEQEAPRLGVECVAVDTNDLEATEAALNQGARMLVVETITNPMLRVSDLAALGRLCAAAGAELLVDNTFASPFLCRPLELGATIAMESLTKIFNGHSDVCLGALVVGPGCERWPRVRQVHSTYGFVASPFDCWLASRGARTLALRARAANENAAQVAVLLTEHPAVAAVSYPGLATHPDHALARRQFGGHAGAMVTFDLAADASRAAERFILAAAEQGLPFCPSLGEVRTTLSHPASTSHRGLSEQARAEQGITASTIRLSVGVEPFEDLERMLQASFA